MTCVALLFAISLLTYQCRADEPPYYSDEQYNDGDFGNYVTQTFVSNPEITAVPVINFMRPFNNCEDGSYLFVAPRGEVADSTLMILDMNGSPVWTSIKNYGQVYNFQVQRYRDQHYLTFWGGNDAVGGHGVGDYYMLDQQYNERYRIRADNGLGADLHAFTIGPEGTALITAYKRMEIDVSRELPGRGMAWIWDSIFQELDIETGEAIFEWRASRHIPVTNSYTAINAASEPDPWDVYHINSVEKDDLGNYLVSMRFLRAILYVDGATGDVLWQLGGIEDSFTDLSGGSATSFVGQHDAHWHDGHRYITLFDNRADWYHTAEDQSKGVRVEVDLDNMTAKLDATFTDPYFKILSTSQGSYQTLPNGNVVLGYGFNGVVSEFSPDGELLCDAYFQPASTFTSGNVQSYRNLKFNWTAWPDREPSLALAESKLYVSWNGATEVESWLFLGSDAYDEDPEEAVLAKVRKDSRSVKDAVIVEKEGFETIYQVYKDDFFGPFVRAIALDEAGMPLGTSNVVDLGDLAASDLGQEGKEDHTSRDKDIEDPQLLIGVGVIAMLTGIFIMCLFLCRARILDTWRYSELGQEEDEEDALTSPHGRVTATIRRLSSFKRLLSVQGRSSRVLEDPEDLFERNERSPSKVCAQCLPQLQVNGVDQEMIERER